MLNKDTHFSSVHIPSCSKAFVNWDDSLRFDSDNRKTLKKGNGKTTELLKQRQNNKLETSTIVGLRPKTCNPYDSERLWLLLCTTTEIRICMLNRSAIASEVLITRRSCQFSSKHINVCDTLYIISRQKRDIGAIKKNDGMSNDSAHSKSQATCFRAH